MFAANVAVTRIINLIVVGVLLVGCALINVITFLDEMIWIWYYDRQGTIQSSGINIIQDLPRFMVLLYALQRFSLDDWGRSTQFKRDEQNVSHNITIFDKHFGDVDPKLLTSDKDKVKNYGLKGRATNVFPVTSKTLEKKYAGITKDGMVAKIFWAEEQRTSEPKILEKVAEIAASHPNTVKGHVLDLLWYHKFEEPTSEIRQQLGVPEPKKGSRVLYILVFRKLFPITELTDAEFFKAWKKCIECHFVLWQEGVYHRDISPPNMMFYRNEKGTAIGVLNDYDLSSLKDAQGPQGNERTGTVPFMALDLLTSEGQGGQVKHLYHHDLESFMWVLAWVCLLYEGGKLLTSKHPLDAWATNDAETVYEKKLAFLKNFTKFKPSGIDSLIWSLVAHCLQVLKDDDHRREKLQFELEHSLNLREEVTVELDDKVLLDIFTSTTPWVQLSLQIGVADI
ncbi:hypothetical protein K503DRAFT_777634 [Rhizopogon vinicolor AM-OR11-026]|uniref:Protein kinase domain-containing protein n=1 Tax=Rhizopogon vinicolor AM-OR11-026 TaxID=1314800 RepID=A0A1B7MFL0_9AGAM|nr:hypothetical protein K503DRAFT_777634 [Rhizopogon vinicolor AM-OR11-026]